MNNSTIQFIGPAQPAQDGGLTCFAIVDGERVKCHFTWEALFECGHLPQPATVEDLFDAGQRRLFDTAVRKIRAGDIDDDMVWVDREDLSS
jgi:uncharacterized protein DUF1488